MMTKPQYLQLEQQVRLASAVLASLPMADYLATDPKALGWSDDPARTAMREYVAKLHALQPEMPK
jgi:hypothetical protein